MGIGIVLLQIMPAIAKDELKPVLEKKNEEIPSPKTSKPDLNLFKQKYCDTLKFSPSVCASRNLHLKQTLPVDVQVAGDQKFELSGLAVRNGQLFGVNDKNDPFLYRIATRGSQSAAERVSEIKPLSPEITCDGKPLDLEGLVPDGKKGFIVINEACSKAIKVANDGTPSLVKLDYLEEQIPTVGNGFEAVALDPVTNRLYLVKERAPRKIYEYDLASGKLLRAFDIPSPIGNPDGSPIMIPNTNPQGKPWTYGPTAADAYVESHFLYLLERESASILKIDLSKETPQLVDFVSYARNNVDNLYDTGEPFGLAEGLTMDGAHLYLATDNNSKPTKRDPKDTRSRLFIFKRPKGF